MLNTTEIYSIVKEKEIPTLIGNVIESEIGRILDAKKRNVNKGADLITKEGYHIEVKGRYFSQPVEISLNQASDLVSALMDNNIPHYYALSFYKTKSGYRINKLITDGYINPTEQDIQNEIILDTIFIFPLPVMLLFMSKLTTTIKQNDKRSSNKGPIEKFYNNYSGSKKSVSKKNKNGNTQFYIIGKEMLSKI